LLLVRGAADTSSHTLVDVLKTRAAMLGMTLVTDKTIDSPIATIYFVFNI
jgi:hypothetical protein